MYKATDQRDAKIISLLWTSLLLFHGGDVLCFEVKCFDVLMSVAGSGNVVVKSFNDLSCGILRDVMLYHGGELLYVVPCSGMECYELCEAMLCGLKWFCNDLVIQYIIL